MTIHYPISYVVDILKSGKPYPIGNLGYLTASKQILRKFDLSNVDYPTYRVCKSRYIVEFNASEPLRNGLN